MTDPSAEPGGPENAAEAEDTGPTEGSTRSAADLPVIDPADLASTSDGGERDDEKLESESERDGAIVGVLFAAGTSSRFGSVNKLLATVDGEPIVRRAAATLCASAVDRVIVIVGHEAGRVREVLDDLDVVPAENAEYERGQSTSLRAGVRAAREWEPMALVIALGDMPAVDTSTIDVLVRAYRAGAGDALAAAFEGERGNPVLFDSRYFDALCDVSGDRGGRKLLLDSSTGALVETGDPGVLRDVDTAADLGSAE